jgi:hypothetical protein
VERQLLSLVVAVRRAALEEFAAKRGTGQVGREIVDVWNPLYSSIRASPRHSISVVAALDDIQGALTILNV